MTFQGQSTAGVNHHIAILPSLLQFIPAEDWSLAFIVIYLKTQEN